MLDDDQGSRPGDEYRGQHVDDRHGEELVHRGEIDAVDGSEPHIEPPVENTDEDQPTNRYIPPRLWATSSASSVLVTIAAVEFMASPHKCSQATES
jgi:hypothetical protein